MRAQAGQELDEPERLEQVIVRSGVQGDDDVGLRVARGQDDDHDVGQPGAQGPAQARAVAVGQPEVEQDQVRLGAAPRQRGVHLCDRGQAYHLMAG